MDKGHIKQKGAIALILSIFILSGLLIISLSVSNLTIDQIELTRQIEESTGAYLAADSGIEYAMSIINRESGIAINDFYNKVSLNIGGLFNANSICSGASTTWFVINADAIFCLEPTDVGGDIVAFKSIGEYKGRIRRSIEMVPIP
ncbi:hypothetical protein ACFLZ0_01255 [Patescibacteria group bacterium]